MNFAQSRTNARLLAAKAFEIPVEKLDRSLKNNGFEFSYRNGKPILTPGNLGLHTRDSLKSVWGFIPYYAQLYYKSLDADVDPSTLNNDELLDAMIAWKEFEHAARHLKDVSPSLGYGTYTPQQVMQGCALERQGYRLVRFNRSSYQDDNLPGGQEYDAIRHVNYWTDTGNKRRWVYAVYHLTAVNNNE